MNKKNNNGLNNKQKIIKFNKAKLYKHAIESNKFVNRIRVMILKYRRLTIINKLKKRNVQFRHTYNSVINKKRRFTELRKLPLSRLSNKIHKHIKTSSSLHLSGHSALPLDHQSAPIGKGSSHFDPDLAHQNQIVYNFNKNTKHFDLNSFLENSFLSMNRLISKPVIKMQPNKVKIFLFFYLNANVAILPHLLENHKNLHNLLKSRLARIRALSEFISYKLKKPVELELVRLHKPYLESNILANTLGQIVKNNKRKKFRGLMFKLFRKLHLKRFNKSKHVFNINKLKPTALVGIRIKLGGRLHSQKIVPRFSSRVTQRGSLSRTNTDLITKSRLTAKNRRGAFSFTVTMGHKFF